MEVLDAINKFEFFIFLVGLGWFFAVWIGRKLMRGYAAARKMSPQARERIPFKKSVHPAVFPN